MTSMNKLTLSSKNQVVIPKAVRSKMGIGSGDQLSIERITETEVVLKKEPSYYDFLGIAKPNKKDAVERVRELRDNWRG